MLYQQAWAFVVAFLAGVVTGLIFDIYRVIRKILGLRKIGTTIGDVLSWGSIAVIIFSLLVIGNWAELRLYIFVALGAGLGIYLQFASVRTRRVVYEILKLVGKLVAGLVFCILTPLRITRRLVSYLLIGSRRLSLLSARILEYLVTFPYLAGYLGYKNIRKSFNAHRANSKYLA